MTPQQLTDDFKKWLTEEVLGEKWLDEPLTDTDVFGFRMVLKQNRTFDNWNDYGAVIEGLKKYKNQTIMFQLIEYMEKEQGNCNIHWENVLNLLTDKGLFFTTLQEWWEKEIKTCG